MGPWWANYDGNSVEAMLPQNSAEPAIVTTATRSPACSFSPEIWMGGM